MLNAQHVKVTRKMALAVFAGFFVFGSCSDSRFSGSSKKKQPRPGAGDDGSCLPEALPSAAVTPSKMFTYLPGGALAPFKQFAAAPVVGKLRSEDVNPTIFVPGFEAESGACHGTVYDKGRLFAFDGKNGAHKWHGRRADGTPVDVDAAIAAAVGDINGDGKMEIFSIERTTQKVVAFSSDGILLWESADSTNSRNAREPYPFWIHGLSLSDIDANGTIEIISPRLVLDAVTGSKKFSLPELVHAYPANVDLKGTIEIVVGTGVINAAGGTICEFKRRNQLETLANLGIAQLHKDDPYLTITGTTLVASDAEQPDLVAYRGDTCAEIFRKPFGDLGGGPPNIADFDGKPDQVLEIGIAGKKSYSVFSASGEKLWSRPTVDASSSRTGSTAFDFNGDGRTEVVYNDELHLRVFDGTSGNVLYEAPNTSYTAHEYPVVADVDGNGTANIIAVSNSCQKGNTGVHVFKEPEDRWVRTRQIWNQYGFNPLTVNDNGTVTGVNADAIVAGALPSQHLAGFRNNIAYPRDPAECK